MFSLDGFRIGDVWPYQEDGSEIVHLFFLIAPRSDPERRWSIGHLTSRNLRDDWEFHDIALAPGKPGGFDDLGLATGSILKHNDRYYMAYTGHGKADAVRCGAAGMAVSDDLFHWERLREIPPIRPDARFYETSVTGSRDFLHWRDPFLLRDGGRFHMFLCARAKTGPVKTRGTVAHLVSDDLRGWETLPPLEMEPFCEELECPQIYRIGERYCLLFCTHRELIDPSLFPAGQVPDGGGFVMFADRLTGPYRRIGTGKTGGDVPGKYFYAPQLLRHGGRFLLIGTLLDGDDSGIEIREIPENILRFPKEPISFPPISDTL